MAKQSKKYHPNLSTLMNLCESNYMLLIRLLACNNDEEIIGNESCFYISDFLSYRITILEITRYTNLVSICQELPNVAHDEVKQNEVIDSDNIKPEFADILRPKMIVRLYHDARMAEVISNQDVRQVKPRYDYPNSEMHLPDEKQQICQFLNEWLQLCLKLGQVNLSVLEK
jgi:uncharacterized protein YqiB (DUF1249 family)